MGSAGTGISPQCPRAGARAQGPPQRLGTPEQLPPEVATRAVPGLLQARITSLSCS